jgi:hypothetical protein
MKYDKCPMCGEPVHTGSHWDCVFEMLDWWIEEEDEEGKPKAKPKPVRKK